MRDAWPTYVTRAFGVATALNKSLLSLYNAGPSTVELAELYVRNVQGTVVTGVFAFFELIRFANVPAAGTVLPSLPRRLDRPLPAGIDARTNATITGEAANVEQRWQVSTDEWAASGALTVPALQAIGLLGPLLATPWPQQGVVLEAGEGVHLRCPTNTTTGLFDLWAVFWAYTT